MRRGRRLGAERMRAWFLSMIESARTTRSRRSCNSSIDLLRQSANSRRIQQPARTSNMF